VAATLLALPTFLGTSRAQEPNRDERWPCIGMLDIVSLGQARALEAFAPTVSVEPRAGARQNDLVRVSWKRLDPAQALCVWGQVAAPGTEFTAMADFVGTTAEGSDRFATEWVHQPVATVGTAGGPLGGEYCYRLVALTREGDIALRSPIREICVHVANPVGPVAPGSGATPLPPTVGNGQSGVTDWRPEVIAWGLLAGGLAVFMVPWLLRRSR
jgi:hypothetical protein